MEAGSQDRTKKKDGSVDPSEARNTVSQLLEQKTHFLVRNGDLLRLLIRLEIVFDQIGTNQSPYVFAFRDAHLRTEQCQV